MKQLPPRHSDPLLRFYHLLAVLELVHRLRVVPACSVVVPVTQDVEDALVGGRSVSPPTVASLTRFRSHRSMKVLQLAGQVGDMKALLAKGDGKGLIRRISALRKASIVLISALTIDISQLPGPRNWAMAGGSNGYRVALVRRQLTLGPISSLPGTAGLPPCISFSTSCPELDSAVPRVQRQRRISSPEEVTGHGDGSDPRARRTNWPGRRNG